MTRSLKLQDFGSKIVAQSEAPPQTAPDTSADLEAYDRGYKAGWADSAEAEQAERRSISADLAKNLSDAELTYEAARRDVLAALGPFFEQVTSILLPEMAAQAVAPTVLAELGALAETQTRARAVIHAAPSRCQNLERLLELDGRTDVTILPEPAFGEGQVSIRLDDERRDLDLEQAAKEISKAISNFLASLVQTEPAEHRQEGAA